jgi:calcium-dependent protein kinase
LKPENILLENNRDLTQIKVADFGTAFRWDPQSKAIFTEKVGTLLYMAPEVYERKYTEKCDIWSLGVLLYKLLSGGFPFDADNEADLVDKIMKGQVDFNGKVWEKKYVDDKAKELILEMLRVDPDRRADSHRALFLLKEWILASNTETQLAEPKIIQGALRNLLNFKAGS